MARNDEDFRAACCCVPARHRCCCYGYYAILLVLMMAASSTSSSSSGVVVVEGRGGGDRAAYLKPYPSRRRRHAEPRGCPQPKAFQGRALKLNSLSYRCDKTLRASTTTTTSSRDDGDGGNRKSRKDATRRSIDRRDASRSLESKSYNDYYRDPSPVTTGPPGSSSQAQAQSRPTPPMPSQLFQQLAMSQLELLASSLTFGSADVRKSKIKSMALYLPQENALTGQLEFLPAVLYPHPDKDRVFIASDATSGRAPTLPRTLTKLPGFAVASSLLPGYPMVSASSHQAGIGVVEEVFCDVRGGSSQNGGRGGGAALSVPLFSGSQTVGVLLVSPSDELSSQVESGCDGDDFSSAESSFSSVWTVEDREQVGRAATSLSLALSMDNERLALQSQNRAVKEALSDSLHQLKNPLQALRTYGKLLQQHIADAEARSPSSSSSTTEPASTTSWSSTRRRGAATTTPRLLELADHLMVQSDRLSQRLKPVDWIVDNMVDDADANAPRPPLLLLGPAEERALVRWTGTGTIPADGSNIKAAASRESSALVPALASASSKPRIKSTENDSTDPGANDASPLSEPANQRYLFDPSADELEIGFLEDVLDPVVSAFRAIADDKAIDFTVEISDDVPGVMVSAQAIQEVMSNLLDNAFKYVAMSNGGADDAYPGRAPRPPRVRLRITSNAPNLPPGATLYVEDNGPGIPASELDAIFTRGYRGSQSSSSTIPGSGLGLGIARALVHKMGGSIRTLTPAQAAKRGCRLSGAAMEVVLYRNPQVGSV
jgi:signal transduction histidine kinase